MAGIYVHIPFCRSRCKYCDFYSTTLLPLRERYINSILSELSLRAPAFREVLSKCSNSLETLYFGGGTPSAISEADISAIINAVRAAFPDENRIFETTIEVNPSDVSHGKILSYRAAGINRVSIGIQSFDDRLLSIIGRRHNSYQAVEAVQIVKNAGIDNISVDLIYGLPGETMAVWQNDIEKVLSLGVQHISLYCLTYEKGTPLTGLRDAGKVTELDDDLLNEMQDYATLRLAQEGFCHYEVSNYALPRFESHHNSSYWNGTPYLGLGASAHSYNGLDIREWNPADIYSYINSVEHAAELCSAQYLPLEKEMLGARERYNERVMLSLRTAAGLDTCILTSEERAMFVMKAEKWEDKKLLARDGTRWYVTAEGLHILNRITEDFIL